MIKIIELLDGTILTLSKPVLFDCLSKYSFLLSDKRIFKGQNYKLGKHSTDENTAIELSSLSSGSPECSGNLRLSPNAPCISSKYNDCSGYWGSGNVGYQCQWQAAPPEASMCIGTPCNPPTPPPPPSPAPAPTPSCFKNLGVYGQGEGGCSREKSKKECEWSVVIYNVETSNTYYKCMWYDDNSSCGIGPNILKQSDGSVCTISECSGNLAWTGNTTAEDYCKKVPIFDCNSWVDGRYNNISFKCEVSNNQCIASSIGCTCLSANNVGDWCKGGGNKFINSRVAHCKNPYGGDVQTLSTAGNGQGCYSDNNCKSHGSYGPCEYVVDNIALPGLDHIKIPCYLPDHGNCKKCRGENKYCYCQNKRGVC